MIFAQVIRHGRHSGEDCAGVRPKNRSGRQGFGLFAFPPTMMLRAAPVFQPAHDQLVLTELLHPIDAEIVVIFALAGWSFGHH